MTDLVKKNAEFGKALAVHAKKKYEDRIQEKCLGNITRLHFFRDEMEKRMKELALGLKLCNETLAAIESGDFEFVGGQIIFNNSDLQNFNPQNVATWEE